VLYYETVVQDSYLFGGCKGWNSFFSTLTLKSIYQDPVSIDIFTYTDYSLSSSTNTNATCATESSATSILSNMISSYQQPTSSSVSAFSCTDGTNSKTNKWNVGSCSLFPVLSVGSSTGSAVSQLTLSACNTNCSGFANTASLSKRSILNSAGVMRLVVATFRDIKPAPTVESITAVTIASLAVTVNVTLDSDGLVYCAAFLPSAGVPASVAAISSQNHLRWSYSNISSILLNGLKPSTAYNVYCATVSADNVQSSLSAVQSTYLAITTACCRTVTATLNTASVRLGASLIGAISVSLSANPDVTLTLTPKVAGSSLSGLFYPTNHTFTSTSLLSTTFSVVQSTANRLSLGNYKIDFVLSGSSSSQYSVSYSKGSNISVISAAAEPPTPKLASATMSNDGTSALIQFSAATNLGGSKIGLSKFSCSQLLRFNYSGGTSVSSTGVSCQWGQDLSSLTVYLGAAVSLSPGDYITLLPKKLKAYCSASVVSTCDSWSYVDSTATPLLSPSNPTTPLVQMSVPSMLGACDSMTIDLSASTGSGGRQWVQPTFRVTSANTAANASVLATYLNSGYSFKPPTAVPHTYLVPGHAYSITVTLCNFLLACSSASATVVVLNQLAPSVIISGSSQLSMLTTSTLSVSASAFTRSCGGSVTYNNLGVTWAIALASDGSSVSVNSLSSNPSKLILAAYSLAASTAYTVTATVTDSTTFKSSSTSISVAVGLSSIYARVLGGSVRSFRIFDTFSLDGSISYDADQENFGNAGLTYAWSCIQTSPSIGSACYITLNSSTTSKAVVKATSTDSAALNSTSSVTLLLSDPDTSRAATASVSISITPADAPSVSITSTIGAAVQPNAAFTLTSSISLTGSGVVLWSVNDASIDLENVSLTAVSLQLTPPGGDSSKEYSVAPRLVLPANSLPAASSLTFTLTAYAVSSASASASASVSIVTNGPPLPGQFEVTPANGEELSTTFTFIASSWSDTDVPITYQFGFIANPARPYLAVQSRSQLSFVAAKLPAGLKSLNYSITCQTQIFDSYGANTSATVSIMVTSKSLNSSALAALAKSNFAAASGSADNTRQVLATFGAVANSVNCTLAPNCTSLHREDCNTVDHTCGSCLSNYLGARGNSNEECSSASDLLAGTSRKLADTSSKSCQSNCFGNGDCVYKDAAGTAIDECLSSDYTCSAVCSCYSGYTGYACSVSEDDANAKSSVREQLTTSLLSLLELDYPDEQAVIAWANSVNSITSSPFELSDSTINSLLAISSSVITAASDNSIELSSLSNMIDAVDNIVASADFNSVSLTSSGSDSSNSTCASGLIDAMSALLLSGLVPGQKSQEYLATSYRLIGQVLDMSQGGVASLSTPLTTLEGVLTPTSVSTVSYSHSTDDSFQLSMISLVSNSFTNASYYRSVSYNCRNNNGTIVDVDMSDSSISRLSTPLRTAISESAYSCSDGDIKNVSFVLRHSSEETFGVTDYVAQNITTACSKGDSVTHVKTCDNGLNVTVKCSGLFAGHIITQCPQRIRQPTCSITDTDITGLVSTNCAVTNYSAWHTTCVCTVCNSSSAVRRRLLTSTASAGVLEVASLASYVGSEYVSIIMTADSLSSADSFQQAVIVISTFIVLWGSVALLGTGIHFINSKRKSEHISRSTQPTAMVQFDKKDWIASNRDNDESNKLSATTSVKRRKTTSNMTAQEKLERYMTSLLPDVFSDKPSWERIYRVLCSNHVYFRVFYRHSTGISFSFSGAGIASAVEQLVEYVALLSYLTTMMLLLAVFYDIQWPSDDGTCDLYSTESSCLATKSVFDKAQSKCEWTASSASSGYCQWVQPKLNVVTMIAISIIVAGISVPVMLLIQIYVDMFLRAPVEPSNGSSSENTAESEAKKRINRMIRPISARGFLKSTSSKNLQDDATNNKAETRLSKRQQPSIVVNPAIRRQSVLANSSAVEAVATWKKRATARISSAGAPGAVNSVDAYWDVDTLGAGLRWQLAHRVRNTRERERLKHQWPQALLSEENPADNRISHRDEENDTSTAVARTPLDGVSMRLMSAELKTVQKEVKTWQEHLNDKDTEYISIKLLELFVLDLLGRDSYRARLISHQFNNVRVMRGFRIPHWGYKALAMAVLLILDAYFIFTCILYGKEKGYQWQFGWLIACAVNLVVDIFVQQAQISLSVYYFIPNVVAYSAGGAVRVAFRQAIDRFCQHVRGGHSEISKADHDDELQHQPDVARDEFSATDYFFVSSHLARQYPDLLESALILSFKSSSIPSTISARWQPAKTVSLASRLRALMSQLDLMSAFSLVITTCILFLGSQPIVVQRLTSGLMTPVSVAIAGYLGRVIITSSLLGTIVVIFLVLAAIYIGYRMWRLYQEQRVHDLRSSNVDLIDGEYGVVKHATEGAIGSVGGQDVLVGNIAAAEVDVIGKLNEIAAGDEGNDDDIEIDDDSSAPFDDDVLHDPKFLNAATHDDNNDDVESDHEINISEDSDGGNNEDNDRDDDYNIEDDDTATDEDDEEDEEDGEEVDDEDGEEDDDEDGSDTDHAAKRDKREKSSFLVGQAVGLVKQVSNVKTLELPRPTSKPLVRVEKSQQSGSQSLSQSHSDSDSVSAAPVMPAAATSTRNTILARQSSVHVTQATDRSGQKEEDEDVYSVEAATSLIAQVTQQRRITRVTKQQTVGSPSSLVPQLGNRATIQGNLGTTSSGRALSTMATVSYDTMEMHGFSSGEDEDAGEQLPAAFIDAATKPIKLEDDDDDDDDGDEDAQAMKLLEVISKSSAFSNKQEPASISSSGQRPSSVISSLPSVTKPSGDATKLYLSMALHAYSSESDNDSSAGEKHEDDSNVAIRAASALASDSRDGGARSNNSLSSVKMIESVKEQRRLSRLPAGGPVASASVDSGDITAGAGVGRQPLFRLSGKSVDVGDVTDSLSSPVVFTPKKLQPPALSGTGMAPRPQHGGRVLRDSSATSTGKPADSPASAQSPPSASSARASSPRSATASDASPSLSSYATPLAPSAPSSSVTPTLSPRRPLSFRTPAAGPGDAARTRTDLTVQGFSSEDDHADDEEVNIDIDTDLTKARRSPQRQGQAQGELGDQLQEQQQFSASQIIERMNEQRRRTRMTMMNNSGRGGNNDKPDSKIGSL
jgi:hypothetical protein